MWQFNKQIDLLRAFLFVSEVIWVIWFYNFIFILWRKKLLKGLTVSLISRFPFSFFFFLFLHLYRVCVHHVGLAAGVGHLVLSSLFISSMQVGLYIYLLSCITTKLSIFHWFLMKWIDLNFFTYVKWLDLFSIVISLDVVCVDCCSSGSSVVSFSSCYSNYILGTFWWESKDKLSIRAM